MEPVFVNMYAFAEVFSQPNSSLPSLGLFCPGDTRPVNFWEGTWTEDQDRRYAQYQAEWNKRPVLRHIEGKKARLLTIAPVQRSTAIQVHRLSAQD